MTKHRSPVLVLLAFAFTPVPTFAADAPATLPKSDGNVERLAARYSRQLDALKNEITQALPVVDERSQADFQAAVAAVKNTGAVADAAQQALGKVQTAKALVDHANGKWLGGAAKGIAQAEAALKKATNDTERAAAQKDLAKWQADKEAGLKALKERQEALDKAKINEPKLIQLSREAQAALDQARTKEQSAAKVLLEKAKPILTTDKSDAKLVTCAVLANATPRGLAEYARQGQEQESLVEKLLADPALMKQMLEAGGARFGKYGRAMEIYAAIQKVSAKSHEGTLQRLALAVSLEHATPIEQSNQQAATTSPTIVDPVRRYQHYETAYLKGELDPAFKGFSVWEYRMVVDSDAPDEILGWGREMLRNYRPDHILNPDYGWRYSGVVRTEVAYGSQNVHCDLASLHNYQNILKNGGVCGRRAFFGRFILKSFGIPAWGVTQHKHAAVSHWTPKGWVVNLGAGFPHSWWDKNEAPRSGADFLLETQARAQTNDYLKVLRAQWISRVLNEQSYNDRKGLAGGFWSGMAHYQTVALAGSAVALGPLGQELAEANESAAAKSAVVEKAIVTEADKKIVIASSGTVTIPAATCSGAPLMKSFQGGQQLFCGSGGKFSCEVSVPRAGRYSLTASIVTVHDELHLQLNPNNAPGAIDMVIPYTRGQWQKTEPVEVTLIQGKNVLSFSKPAKSFSLKEMTLTPVVESTR